MIYIIGLTVFFLGMCVLGNMVVEIICAIKEKRKVNLIKAFKE